MKKTLILTLLLGCIACHRCDRSNPAEVAETFLNAYFSYDFDRAEETADDQTQTAIRQMREQFRAQGTDLGKLQWESERYLVTVHHVLVEGDTAICSYTVKKDETGANAMNENLILVRKGDGWAVNF